MKKMLILTLILFAIALPVHAQDQETVDPALATAVADQLTTDFPQMTLTAEALTPTPEPTLADETSGDVNVDVNIEQPADTPADGVAASTAREWGTLIITVAALVVLGVVARTGILQAASTVPKEVFDTAMFGVQRILDALEGAARGTPTPLDEMGVVELRKLVADLARQVEENRITAGAQKVVTPADTVP